MNRTLKNNGFQYNYFYKITNIVNNKFYYGVHNTNNLNDSYLGSGMALGGAKKKYGKENFKREILQFFKTYEECLAYEALIVDEDMVNDPMCYNLKTGGKGGLPSGETKQKMSVAHQNISEETRQKLIAAKRNMSEKTRQKMSSSAKGRIVSEETRQKMSVALKGKIQSEETRKNRIISLKGRILSDEHRAKLSAAAKARTKHSDKYKKETI